MIFFRVIKIYLGKTFSAAILGLLLFTHGSAFGNEITDDHLQAARQALKAINATQRFDNILPASALRLKNKLIQANPDLEGIISSTVDEKTLELAARRSDLENEAARIYANFFTQEQLNEISLFYSSDTGKKLLSDGPLAIRELLKGAEVWSRGLNRDLAQAVIIALNERLGENQIKTENN